MTIKIYLAGPIQHVRDYGKGWRGWIKDNYDNHDRYEFIDPMDKYNTMEEAKAEWTNRDVVRDDLEMIRKSDALLVHWEAVPTAGTPMEIFFAYREMAMPVVVQTTLHHSDVSPWIDYHADHICESFGEALTAIGDLIIDRIDDD